MDAALEGLEKRLKEHRAQVERIKKRYRFNPEDSSTYFYAAAISREDRRVRAQLIEQYKSNEQKREQ